LHYDEKAKAIKFPQKGTQNIYDVLMSP
jgi:hypothetical protein